MATAIITLLCAVVPLIVWLIKRHASKVDDPQQQNKNRYDQAKTDVAKGNDIVASQHGLDDLDELERVSHRPGGAGK